MAVRSLRRRVFRQCGTQHTFTSIVSKTKRDRFALVSRLFSDLPALLSAPLNAELIVVVKLVDSSIPDKVRVIGAVLDRIKSDQIYSIVHYVAFCSRNAYRALRRVRL